MRIGIIADTHGVLHPRVQDVFAGVDHILHAGDVGGAHILDALRAIAPVTAVAGNNDDADGYAIATSGPSSSPTSFRGRASWGSTCSRR